jgi:multiple antibiotic resistance protein
MHDFLELIVGTVGTLLPIANPFSTAPVFATFTSDLSEDDRNKQAYRAGVYMAAVLFVTLFAGALVLTFFGISLSALRIAGGLIIARIGFSMVMPKTPDQFKNAQKSEPSPRHDFAFTPIAMPLLSGPGSMAATLSMASVAEGPSDYAGVGLGIIIVAFISWLTLRGSTLVAHVLGATGVDALSRVMGFLLVCIGVVFVGNGILEALTDPRIMGPIVEAAQKAAMPGQ